MIGYALQVHEPPLPDAWPRRFEPLDASARGAIFATGYARWKTALPRIVVPEFVSDMGTEGLYRLTRDAGRLIYFTSMAVPAPFRAADEEPFFGIGAVYRRALVVDDTGDNWQAHYDFFEQRKHRTEDDLSGL